MNLQRGDIVVMALAGDYGKPRPAVVVQSNLFDALESITLCPITSYTVDAPLFRLALLPNNINHLGRQSYVMVDKIATVKKGKIDKKIGALTVYELDQLDQQLRRFLDL